MLPDEITSVIYSDLDKKLEDRMLTGNGKLTLLNLLHQHNARILEYILDVSISCAAEREGP
jgi:hypothetical protein